MACGHAMLETEWINTAKRNTGTSMASACLTGANSEIRSAQDRVMYKAACEVIYQDCTLRTELAVAATEESAGTSVTSFSPTTILVTVGAISGFLGWFSAKMTT